MGVNYDYNDGGRTYFVTEYKTEGGNWVPDEEVTTLEELYEKLIRHAAEVELENMLLKNNVKKEE